MTIYGEYISPKKRFYEYTVFSTKCEITQLQIILVILTDGKEF